MAAPPLAVVRPEWVDSYGHMNMAFYLAVFDMATDALWPRLGLGAPFKAKGLGTFAAETWVDYVREVREGMPLDCESEVLSFDAKRLLAVHRMRHLLRAVSRARHRDDPRRRGSSHRSRIR